MEHKKWECPNIEVEKKKRKTKKVEQRKAKEHCVEKGMPPRNARVETRGWMTKWEVVLFMECREYEYKGAKTQEN